MAARSGCPAVGALAFLLGGGVAGANVEAFRTSPPGQTRPMSTPPADEQRPSTRDTAASRGEDERRETVNPAQNPAPRSPEPDQEAIEKSEETLERVKPY